MENMFEEYEKRTSLHANKKVEVPIIKQEVPTQERPRLIKKTVKYYPTKKKKYKPIITSKDVESLKSGIKWAVKGYSGTAKQAYEERKKKMKLRQQEMEYKYKIKELKQKEKLQAKGRRAVQYTQAKRTGRKVGRTGSKVGSKISNYLNRNKSIYK